MIGKLLSNNLINLKIYDNLEEILKANGKELSLVEEAEPEPSLGNGGPDVWRRAFWIPLLHTWASGRGNRPELSFRTVQTGI